MTPQEALDLLDVNVSKLAGSREDHEKIKLAVKTLSDLIAGNSQTPTED